MTNLIIETDMLKTFNEAHSSPGHRSAKRFVCMRAGQSSGTALLQSCPVVTAGGQSLGQVQSVMIDAGSRQLRYVVVAPRKSKATLIIPWRALYFDSLSVRLVHYTLS